MQPSNNLRRYNHRSGCQLPPTARSQGVRIKDSAIALDKDRTLRIKIRIETRKCDRNTEMKSDRPQVILKYWVLSIAIAIAARLGSGASRKLCNLTLGSGQSTSRDFSAAVDNYTSSEGGV
ncbi:MAG: hypothetical protein ICV61_11955, partial [Microcoleus sp. Co-bin12]|nr:hypothetical protein [Microcoleus sp. Co-bin12]